MINISGRALCSCRFAEKFYDEERLVAKFNGSSSIVNVFDFFYKNSTVYYYMEYL